jgi:hypothetical protein
MRNPLVFTVLAAALGFAAAASAQTPAPPVVNVSISPALEQRAKDYGQRALNDISKDLQETVQGAVRHARGPQPVRVDLVIEDAVPNRPTFDQLGRNVGLSMRSVGLGGARISGVLTYADGVQRPIKDQFYETDLREEIGVTTWSDADRAFEQVASDIGRGKLPDRYAGAGPTGTGHFGYPINDR